MTEERAARGAGRGESGYPGAGLGLPASGPGSVAGMGRRLGALFIDYLLCCVIAAAVTGSFLSMRLWPVAIFAVSDYVLTALTGLTVGKRLLRIRVVRTSGQRIGLGWAAVRTVLLITVIPALLLDRDLRGMHDRAADAVVVTF